MLLIIFFLFFLLRYSSAVDSFDGPLILSNSYNISQYLTYKKVYQLNSRLENSNENVKTVTLLDIIFTLISREGTLPNSRKTKEPRGYVDAELILSLTNNFEKLLVVNWMNHKEPYSLESIDYHSNVINTFLGHIDGLNSFSQKLKELYSSLTWWELILVGDSVQQATNSFIKYQDWKLRRLIKKRLSKGADDDIIISDEFNDGLRLLKYSKYSIRAAIGTLEIIHKHKFRDILALIRLEFPGDSEVKNTQVGVNDALLDSLARVLASDDSVTAQDRAGNIIYLRSSFQRIVKAVVLAFFCTGISFTSCAVVFGMLASVGLVVWLLLLLRVLLTDGP
ncbi:hypothetical protein NCAS_0A01140 [Naumovozyma castellii]|uniref:Uncharacterized protein n=1 Tax=Naumovozyma castellii TaxID=27288 RepID=G0V5D8_NAUCA|nr:hypothetical protein NCAS_0A01140 [Naumovozyma castellii CBS 4309]CCC66674.1 hypothetical protein NCAS_0A01140 [Naumovozyma castellii CBS 4309]